MTVIDDTAQHAAQWDSINLHDRLREALAAKIEGDNGRMPERGMFCCADVLALLDEADRLRPKSYEPTTDTTTIRDILRPLDVCVELLNLDSGDI